MILELIVIVIAGLYALGYIFILSRLKTESSRSDESEIEKRTLLSFTVPKNNDKTPQAAEQMFVALHGLFRPESSSQIAISFEIGTINQQVVFFCDVPDEAKDFVVSQIYAQYPNVEFQELDENSRRLQAETRSLALTELSLKKPTVYSIKTYQNFDVDPLSSLTAVLGSVTDKEDIRIQVIVSAIDDDWQEMGDEEIKLIKDPPKKEKTMWDILVVKTKIFVVDFFSMVFSGKMVESKEDKKEDKKELPGPVQQAIKGIEDKVTKLGFAVTIRLLTLAPDEVAAKARLEQIIGAFKQFNTLNQNSFVSGKIDTEPEKLGQFNNRQIGESPLILNVAELASIFHLPSGTVSTPSIQWSGSKRGEPPANLPIVGTVQADELTVIAETNFRSRVNRFGLKKKDRRLHTYVIGKTGTGKSTFMENMIFDDIREGRGVAIVDPHGETVQHVLSFIPKERIQDVVYFNPADAEFPIGFNILESINPEQKNIVASGVVGIFKKIFGESWGPRLEYILRNVVLALLETPNSTLLGVMRVLTDNAYRRIVVSNLTDPVIKDFFVNEYDKYDAKFRQEAISPIQNKVGQFLSSSIIRNIIGQPKSTIDIKQVMDTGRILLADLSTGKIGEDSSALLGSMLITKIQLSAMQRTYIPESERRDFYLYVDEFQNFATDSFATILSEARKYRLNLVMTNQYINQLSEMVSGAIFGNVGTMIAFRVGATDASVLEKEFVPVFEANDLINLPNYQIYVKMAIDGVTMPAFSARTLPPPSSNGTDLSKLVIESSRQQFGTPISEVEDYIAEWSLPINLGDDSSQKHLKSPLADSQDSSALPSKNNHHQTTKIERADHHPDASHTPQETDADPSSPIRESETGEGSLLKNKKIQILKDRFDRPWYAISNTETAATSPTESKIASHHPESRGEPVATQEESSFITWEKADELGLKISKPKDKKNKTDLDGFTPIDEL